MAGYFVKNRAIPNLSNNHLQLPAGSSEIRPIAPLVGGLRFNTDTGSLEVFNGASFIQVANAGKAPITVDSFTGDGSTLTFSMSELADTATEILVFVGSVYQQPDTVYSVTGSGNDVTFTEAVPAGMEINVIHGFATVGT